MRTRIFGRTGWAVSEIGYGMWGMGGWTGSDDAESRASLHRAVELGCTFFDTALAYGIGRSEKLLGEVVRAHADRGLIVATKVPPKNLKWPGKAEYPVAETFPPDHIHEFTAKSLANLGLPRIDLLQFHVWDDAWAPDDGWKRAVEDLKRAGTIRAFGISVNRWQAENVLAAIETGLVDAVQVVYNIFDQAPEDRLFPACRAAHVAVIARVPFDEGSLTGTLTADTRFPDGDWRASYFTQANLDATLPRVERVRALVPTDSTLPETSLRFILSSPDVTTVIPGMRKTRHVEANLDASDRGPLPASLVNALRAARWDRVPNFTP
jgi:aryl-alcohol dehydrogenase-like predicted oxidoreductase